MVLPVTVDFDKHGNPVIRIRAPQKQHGNAYGPIRSAVGVQPVTAPSSRYEIGRSWGTLITNGDLDDLEEMARLTLRNCPNLTSSPSAMVQGWLSGTRANGSPGEMKSKEQIKPLASRQTAVSAPISSSTYSAPKSGSNSRPTEQSKFPGCAAVMAPSGISHGAVRTLEPCVQELGVNSLSVAAVRVPLESPLVRDLLVVSRTSEQRGPIAVGPELVVVVTADCPCDDSATASRTLESIAPARTARAVCESAPERGIHVPPTDVQLTAVRSTTESCVTACGVPVALLATSLLSPAAGQPIVSDATAASVRTLSPSPSRTARVAGDVNLERDTQLSPIETPACDLDLRSLLGGASGARTPLPRSKCKLCFRACGLSLERPTQQLPLCSSDYCRRSVIVTTPTAAVMFQRRDATVTYKYRRRLNAVAA
jgi:hypothetical protein